MPDKQPSPSHEALRFFNNLAKELHMLSTDKSFRVPDFVINLFDAEFAQLRERLGKSEAFREELRHKFNRLTDEKSELSSIVVCLRAELDKLREDNANLREELEILKLTARSFPPLIVKKGFVHYRGCPALDDKPVCTCGDRRHA